MTSRLPAIDVVRLLTVALVITVHTVSVQLGGAGLADGAVLTVAHVSREVFFLLTAFVLVYGYGDREGVRWPAFWRRRYLLVGVPYLVWSAIYFVVLGGHGLVRALLTGTAEYHLYFLLVSMQLYLVFPLLRRFLRATAGRHRVVLAAAVLYQLLAYAVAPHLPFRVDALLPAYLGFVLVGGVAAVHASSLFAVTLRHRRLLFVATTAIALLGAGWFLAQVRWLGRDPATASRVFQPVVVVESLAIAWSFLALGLTWRSRRWIRVTADASFGVYLAHPLVLAFLPSFGAGLPGVVVTVPLVYAACVAGVAALRRTPLSLPLAGHPRRRPAVSVSPGGLRCERQPA